MARSISRAVESALRPDTAVVSIMWANNETGVLFPIAKIAAMCRDRAILIHTDAVQTPGKLTIDVNELGVGQAFRSRRTSSTDPRA